MPKKTKREKIVAEYRRKVKLLQEVQKIEIPKKTEAPKIISTKKQDLKLDSKSDKEDQITLKYFFKDLKRSLFYIVLIIVLEVLLYFVKI